MNSDSGGDGVSGGLMMRSPFTLIQWQELEHQALIFKYMMAGLPVPPDLLLPIQKSLEFVPHMFYHHPTMSYCSFYGKKVDPEPGRCRRTDGKKWRCSKDAYPDSKYCERHMHRGRNRSRKPVESQPMTQSSSTVTSLPTTRSKNGSGIFPNPSLHVFNNTPGTASVANPPRYNVDSIPYGIPSKDYRYLEGLKPEVGEHRFISEASTFNRSQINESLDNVWPVMPSRVSSFQNDYPQHTFFGSDYASRESMKQEGQSLRSFFDEWPRARDSWSGFEDETPEQTVFSTTQLSISIPMASPNFSATSS